MFRIALKSVLAKKLRLFSTALSIMLGVAFLAGTLVFTDTISRTFDDLFADVFQNTDAYVRSSSTTDLGMGSTQRGRMPESVVDTVEDVPGVADAQGVVQAFAQIVGSDGDAIGDPGRGAPTFGMNCVPGEQSRLGAHRRKSCARARTSSSSTRAPPSGATCASATW